jgi:hypothetical protein
MQRTNKQDAYFTRDVWEHHLGTSGEFDGFTRIIRTGDSGGSFHNWKTFYYESMIEKVIILL